MLDPYGENLEVYKHQKDTFRHVEKQSQKENSDFPDPENYYKVILIFLCLIVSSPSPHQ